MFAQSCGCDSYSVMLLMLIMWAQRIQIILASCVCDIVVMFYHVSTPATTVLVSCVLDIVMMQIWSDAFHVVYSWCYENSTCDSSTSTLELSKALCGNCELQVDDVSRWQAAMGWVRQLDHIAGGSLVYTCGSFWTVMLCHPNVTIQHKEEWEVPFCVNAFFLHV